MTKQEYFERPDLSMFMDDPKAIAAYCRREWPEECRHVIRVADEVCQNHFIFDLRQDLERTWVPVEFPEGKIDWEYMPGEDKEFIFQFNRHRFFICLGQAYQLTGNEAYAEKFVSLLMDWIGSQKRTKDTENTTWRILEAGFRGEFWVKAMWYFKDSPSVTDQVVDAFARCLEEHGEFIMEMHSPYRYISNWGVIENHGLFEIGIVMTDRAKGGRFIETALGHLKAQAGMQVMGDGVQWEQSPSYHNEVLHCFEDVLILARRNGIKVPDAVVNAARKMAYADLAWKKPDHHQFMMGDSDDADIRDFLSKAAWFFRDPVLKFGGYDRLDYDSAWDLGMEAVLEYQEMESRQPEFESMALSDSGNYYFRDSWKENGNLLHFHCGTMGAGHGHSDKLHVDLCINGEDVLTDAGRFTYVAGPDRYGFKNPDAHNTLTVDNRFFTVCRDSWECSKLCAPVKRQYGFGPEYGLVQGGHLGYMDRGVYVNRKIIHIRPEIYIIADEMYAGDTHTYQQYWNFSDRGRVSLHRAGDRNMPDGPLWTAEFATDRTRVLLSIMSHDADVDLGTSRIARDYNRCVNRSRIRLETSNTGFTSLITVIQGGAREAFHPYHVRKFPVRSALKGIIYPDSMAEAVGIEGNGKDYVAVICHQEVNSPTDMVEAEGCMGFGNVIVFDRNREMLTGTVLDY